MTFSKDTGLFEDNYDAEIVLTDIDMHCENCGDIKVQALWEYATFPVAIYI